MSQYRRSSRQCNQCEEIHRRGYTSRLNTAEAVDNVI